MPSEKLISTRKEVALITGASSGIGRQLAYRFGAGGYDLVLVGRNAQALGTLAAECEIAYRCTAIALTCDLSGPGSALDLFDELEARGIEVHALVNNAGFGVHGLFAETSLTREMEMVNLQIGTLVQLTKLCLPAMRRRRAGKILNVASVYSYSPVPLQAVYSACKAFLLSFSQSLRDEVAQEGITVTVLLPGVTRTEFRRRAGMREKKASAGMSAEAVALYGYRALMRGRGVAVPGWINRVFVTVVRHAPVSFLASLMRLINGLRGVNGAPASA